MCETEIAAGTFFRFFTILSSILAQPALELAYCDFESAAIIAAGNIFRQVRVQGYFFHLCQAVYRKLCKLGFQTRYGSDEDFAVQVSSCISAGFDKGGDSYGTCIQFQVRMLPALAFLPPAEVAEAFEDVMTRFPPEALQIALYFEDTYIGRRRRNGLLSATFPTSIWSVHRSVVEGLPRTNNSAEAWHRSFQVCIILIFSDSPFSYLSYTSCYLSMFLGEYQLHPAEHLVFPWMPSERAVPARDEDRAAGCWSATARFTSKVPGSQRSHLEGAGRPRQRSTTCNTRKHRAKCSALKHRSHRFATCVSL